MQNLSQAGGRIAAGSSWSFSAVASGDRSQFGRPVAGLNRPGVKTSAIRVAGVPTDPGSALYCQLTPKEHLGVVCLRLMCESRIGVYRVLVGKRLPLGEGDDQYEGPDTVTAEVRPRDNLQRGFSLIDVDLRADSV